ncbi:hypothetical protein ACJQWK_03452 [Exserohilum turcicum]|uniref:Uncharacterized protein n=1 Tax=Exserohilum turcicum (strain 28A) TaxID=671987 RepID=R0KH34_EXST2|nr:uncharacterized protein SETTUDRAFT_18817 [Exserohilum turcica Et28A]EOA92168.1 hypothetical protein SETTUDRAFT_18817 [Exserohilum turcica Et28A]
MSFGFSVGDIILLGQIAYRLYSSITSGREAASRDLEELRDVLFSLNCSLAHLKDVSKNVLDQPGLQYGGPGFKDNLDLMISSCATTLQELESVTEKYLSSEKLATELAKPSKGKTKMHALENMKKSMHINWRRIRWDYEKHSLQQYREKLKSHTDAINLILTSAILATSVVADDDSKKSHEKTHAMLDEVLKRPQADDALQTVLEEIRKNFPPPGPAAQATPNVLRRGMPSNTFIAAYSVSTPLSIGKLGTAADGPVPSVRMNASIPIPSTSNRELPEKVNLENGTSDKSLSELNARRRAFGAKEYEAFMKRHAPPKKVSKPSFLTAATPNIKELHECIPYLFGGQPEGKQQTEELKSEIRQWSLGFSLLVKHEVLSANSDAGLLEILRTLNETVEDSSQRVRQLFYEISDLVGLPAALDRVLAASKSVRVKKEIEDFQDTKDDWQDHVRGN